MNMRQIYRKIAKKHGVSVEEVKRDMQAAIDYAYQSPPNDNVSVAYQNQVPHKGSTPTTEEFIRFAAAKVKAQSTQNKPK